MQVTVSSAALAPLPAVLALWSARFLSMQDNIMVLLTAFKECAGNVFLVVAHTRHI